MLCMTNFARAVQRAGAADARTASSAAPPNRSRPTSSAATNSATKRAAARSPSGPAYGYLKGCWRRPRTSPGGPGPTRPCGSIFTAWLESPEHHENILGPYKRNRHRRCATATSKATKKPRSGPRTSAATSAERPAGRRPPRMAAWRPSTSPTASGYLATELTRGPWDPGAQHAGPPAALLGRELELLPEAEDFQVCRITFEILRLDPDRAGRGRGADRAAGAAGADARGRAAGRRRGADDGARPGGCGRRRSTCPPRRSRSRPGRRCRASPARPTSSRAARTSATTRRWRCASSPAPSPRSARRSPGCGCASPLVGDEPPTPLQRILVAADVGNGISARGRLPPLPLRQRRPHRAAGAAAGGRVGLRRRRHPPARPRQRTAESVLGDERGRLGRALQTLLVAERWGIVRGTAHGAPRAVPVPRPWQAVAVPETAGDRGECRRIVAAGTGARRIVAGGSRRSRSSPVRDGSGSRHGERGKSTLPCVLVKYHHRAAGVLAPIGTRIPAARSPGPDSGPRTDGRHVEAWTSHALRHRSGRMWHLPRVEVT